MAGRPRRRARRARRARRVRYNPSDPAARYAALKRLADDPSASKGERTNALAAMQRMEAQDPYLPEEAERRSLPLMQQLRSGAGIYAWGVSGHAGTHPAVGKIISLPRPFQQYLPPGVWLVVVAEEKRGDFFLLYPVDLFDTFVGVTDVSIRSPLGRLVMRGGLGALYAAPEIVGASEELGSVDGWDLARIQDKAQQMFGGDFAYGLLQEEDEADPSYEEWLEELGPPLERLRTVLTSDPRIQ